MLYPDLSEYKKTNENKGNIEFFCNAECESVDRVPAQSWHGKCTWHSCVAVTFGQSSSLLTAGLPHQEREPAVPLHFKPAS